MAHFEMTEMTWQEIDSLDRQRTMVFLPLSPIEEHGPHLPLGTDFFASQDIARNAILIISTEESSLNYLLHPGIPLGCAEITKDFPGTVSLRGSTLVNVIFDISSSLASQGFRYIIIVNHHFDLYHMKAISVAIDMIKNKYHIEIYEPLGTDFLSKEPELVIPVPGEPDFNLNKEAHAEFEETSFIMYQYPGLLKESYRNLPPVHIDLTKHVLMGQWTLKKMGAHQGYVGTPAKANREYGRSYLEAKSRLLAEYALKLYRGEKLPEMSLKIRLAFKLLKLA